MMHPEIKKFWEQLGHTLMGYSLPNIEIWAIVSDPEYYNQGGPPPPLDEDIVFFLSKKNPIMKPYIFEYKSYSEEEMLRMIKLKAFL